jgi:aryl-alcohol dehydrogenase-like predicted oxidoreductase
MQSLWASDRLNLVHFVSIQPHYSLVHRAEFERELADVCRQYKMGVIPYSPLAGGFLTGKYRRDSQMGESERARSVTRYFNDRNWNLLEKLEAIGKERGDYSISQIALAWLLSDPLITSAIIGPRTLEQMDDNLKAAGLRLTAAEKQLLDEASSWRESGQ